MVGLNVLCLVVPVFYELVKIWRNVAEPSVYEVEMNPFAF